MMLPEEEEEAASSNPQEVPEAPSWPSVEKSSDHHPDKQDVVSAHDAPGSSRSGGGGSHHSSSHRDRPGRSDEHYHRSSNRERDRSYRDRDRERDRDRDRGDRDRGDRDRGDRDRGDRDRDRDRDRNYRDRNYGGSVQRDSCRDDRYDRRDRRDRRSRTPEERSRGGGSRKHSSRSRSRSKEPRSRDVREHRSHRRSPRDDRSQGVSSSREVPRDRVEQDRLSAEIEQELANLRRQHDLKEALKKDQGKGGGKDARKPTTNKPKKLVPAFTVLKPQKPDFVPYDVGASGQTDVAYVPEIQTEEERIEFQRKMQEKLQLHLAAEGKLYPPPSKPKCDPPTPIAVSGFANDGSFLEMFKKLQEHQVVTGGLATAPATAVPAVGPVVPGAVSMMGLGSDKSIMSTPAVAGAGVVVVPKIPVVAQNPLIAGTNLAQIMPVVKSVPQVKPSAIDKEPPPPPLPVFGRRRGGKILKTGLVKKVRPIEESAAETPNDPWSLYLQEVKKYKSASCDADSKTRPLVK